AERIAEARTLTAELVDELRKAAQQVHNPLLDQQGLPAALRSVARVQGTPPATVTPEVAVTAYRLCAAAGGEVDIRIVDGTLELGLHGDVSGLEPRVEALGGTLEVSAGTVRARLPLHPRPGT